jgi:hypothetical protein
MYLMAGLLLVGCVCNLMVSPVEERHHQVEIVHAHRHAAKQI